MNLVIFSFSKIEDLRWRQLAPIAVQKKRRPGSSAGRVCWRKPLAWHSGDGVWDDAMWWSVEANGTGGKTAGPVLKRPASG